MSEHRKRTRVTAEERKPIDLARLATALANLVLTRMDGSRKTKTDGVAAVHPAAEEPRP